jgi:hypothetical protein
MACRLRVNPFNKLLEFVSTKISEFQKTIVVVEVNIEVWIAIAAIIIHDHLEALRAAIRSFKLSVEAGAGAVTNVGVPTGT